MKENTKNKVIPLILSAVVIVLDQISKALVVKYIPRLTIWTDDGIIEILGKYLRLIHVRNNAIAFSMGHTLSQNARGLLFAIMPLLIIIAVYVIYFRNNDFTKTQRWCICGILGGGIGNLIDRFFRPDGVVDFIDCYFFGIFGWDRWPTYNIADSAVVVCGAIFVITFLKQIYDDAKKAKSKKEGKNE
ncbi:MAG: signal peptidase II [Treponema sp.]|nr:signal peptidase II [Candidatus Treponema equi]